MLYVAFENISSFNHYRVSGFQVDLNYVEKYNFCICLFVYHVEEFSESCSPHGRDHPERLQHQGYSSNRKLYSWRKIQGLYMLTCFLWSKSLFTLCMSDTVQKSCAILLKITSVETFSSSNSCGLYFVRQDKIYWVLVCFVTGSRGGFPFESVMLTIKRKKKKKERNCFNTISQILMLVFDLWLK